MGDDLERAYQDHLTRDASPESTLALELAKLEQPRRADLQKEAMAARPPDRAAADQLAEMAGGVASRLVYERVLARAYQRTGHHADVLTWAGRAIAVTPRWDPRAVAVVCNTIAWSLHLTGRDADALRWCERGLAAYPAYGMLLGTLCEVVAKADPARAVAVHRFLQEAATMRRSGAITASRRSAARRRRTRPPPRRSRRARRTTSSA